MTSPSAAMMRVYHGRRLPFIFRQFTKSGLRQNFVQPHNALDCHGDDLSATCGVLVTQPVYAMLAFLCFLFLISSPFCVTAWYVDLLGKWPCRLRRDRFWNCMTQSSLSAGSLPGSASSTRLSQFDFRKETCPLVPCVANQLLIILILST
jgi:hypothetical protein